LSIQVVFGASHEKGTKLMELEQPGVVYILCPSCRTNRALRT
jgi:hypothetical protein